MNEESCETCGGREFVGKVSAAIRGTEPGLPAFVEARAVVSRDLASRMLVC